MTTRRAARIGPMAESGRTGVASAVASAIDSEGRLWVRVSGRSEACLARIASSFSDDDARAAVELGDSLIVLLESEDEGRPIVLGRTRERIAPAPGAPERVEITALSEIVLRSGKSTVILKNDGRILIRGAEIASRASGTHRIRGGSIKLN